MIDEKVMRKCDILKCRLAFISQHGVYLVPGCECDCPEPGWVRIVFTISNEELEEFLDRFEEGVKAYVIAK